MTNRLWLLDYHQHAVIIPAVLMAGISLYSPLYTVPLLLAYTAVVLLVLPNLVGGSVHRNDDVRSIVGMVLSLGIISTLGTVTPLIVFAYVPMLSVLIHKLRTSLPTATAIMRVQRTDA